MRSTQVHDSQRPSVNAARLPIMQHDPSGAPTADGLPASRSHHDEYISEFGGCASCHGVGVRLAGRAGPRPSALSRERTELNGDDSSIHRW